MVTISSGYRHAKLRVMGWTYSVIMAAVVIYLILRQESGDIQKSGDGRAVAEAPDPVAASIPEPDLRAVRSAAEAVSAVRISVKNPSGSLLAAEVRSQELSVTIDGVGWLPLNAGTVTVHAKGHVSKDVVILDMAQDVVLQPSHAIRGFVFDAATGTRIPKASVRTVHSVQDPASRTCVTDEDGTFTIDGLESGELVLLSEAEGYVPYFDGAKATFPGSRITLAGDLRVEIPLSPVYVALCNIQNSTNLSDDVLGALLACSFSEKPGQHLPQWFEGQVFAQIAAVAKFLGIRAPYGDASLLDSMPPSLQGKVDFVVRGQGSAGSTPVTFQPLQEFLRDPAPSLHVISNHWNLGRLTVESPIGLRICPKQGIVFGGLKTSPGTCTYDLPHGTYIVSPLDAHPLLDSASWTREVTLPTESRLSISPPEGFGTLELAGGTQWPDGILGCQGPSFTMGIPLKDLPTSMPASPGEYDFYVVLGAGQSQREAWRGKVTLRAGESKVFRIGVE